MEGIPTLLRHNKINDIILASLKCNSRNACPIGFIQEILALSKCNTRNISLTET